ncbi:hypothetical protein BD410DRAFT_478378 [Rickenella mellea]|uniref:F-box domain-containing protein n=1 Tax=Rickenella mellea TaxID=50990 RepID=A0A4Y7QHY4_9AGAM|nr:hypothetical protein BD410DRAFT_478378 [Rickenella mellea]
MLSVHLHTTMHERRSHISDLTATASGNSDGLKIGSESLRNARSHLRTSRSPIQRLHLELLNEIFRHCLNMYDYPLAGRLRLPRPSVQEAPLILCRICRQWRQLVLANPLLWAQIELSGKDPSSHLAALDEWLARSQRSPLHLSVSYIAEYGSTIGFEEGPSKVVAKFVPHLWRWKYAYLNVPPACARPIVEKLGEGSNNLQILTICSSKPVQAKESFALDLSGQKVLSELRLDYRIHFIPNHSPMNNIRILHIAFSTIDEYLYCLDVCPAVSDVVFTFRRDCRFQPLVYQTLRVVPSVTTLTLGIARCEDESQSLSKFLPLLEVPNLRKLVLSLCRSPEEWNMPLNFSNVPTHRCWRSPLMVLRPTITSSNVCTTCPTCRH